MQCLLLGLGASILAWATRAAGGLIENAFAPGLLAQGVFGGDGPFSRLYTLGFALVLLSSGGYVALVGALTAISGAAATGVHVHLATRALALMHAFSLVALTLAGPALLAQAFAALIAGVVARSRLCERHAAAHRWPRRPFSSHSRLVAQMWALAFQLSARVATFGTHPHADIHLEPCTKKELKSQAPVACKKQPPKAGCRAARLCRSASRSREGCCSRAA